uniref:Uncharacterized protein n=1 Tax=Solanum lycopersicum TaxID=4081 RepID=A0A3Q7GMG0_SOLLC
MEAQLPSILLELLNTANSADGPVDDRLKNLSAMEANIVRPFVTKALQTFHKLNTTEAIPESGSIPNRQRQAVNQRDKVTRTKRSMKLFSLHFASCCDAPKRRELSIHPTSKERTIINMQVHFVYVSYILPLLLISNAMTCTINFVVIFVTRDLEFELL